MATNLPNKILQDSAAGTKLFFDSYGQSPLEFNATDVDACFAFFTSKGFSEEASLSVSSVLLKQAKLDGVPIFEFLDTISGYDTASLSRLVGEILNNNRVKTSTLGFRSNPVNPEQIARNIAA